MHELHLAHELGDDALLAATSSLVGRERQATAALVAHLAVIDERSLALKEGYPSLFAYCREALGFSEAEACHRIEAARTARRFPLVLDMLRANELTMTTAARLGRHLTPENHQELLRAARGKTKEQVEGLIATVRPKPDAPTILRRVPSAPLAPAFVPAPAAPGVRITLAPAPAPAAVPIPRPVVQPLAPERYRYQLTIDAETRALLQEARDLAAHLKGSDDASLLKEALRLYVADRKRKQFASTTRPGKPRPRHPDSRDVPAALAREVDGRDGHRCAWVSKSGRRCTATRNLQYHHVYPYGIGGAMTAINVELRCAAHNRYEARVYFARDREIGRPALRSVRPVAHPVQTGSPRKDLHT